MSSRREKARSDADRTVTAVAKLATGMDSRSIVSSPTDSLASASSLRTQQTRMVSSDRGAAGARGHCKRTLQAHSLLHVCVTAY